LIRHRGNIFILSAPSGTGKSTLAKRLVRDLSDLIFSISFTTRNPRQGEVDGQDYFFVDRPIFDGMVAQNELAEWVEVYDNRYGTGKAWVQEKLDAGVDVLLDIETVGARNVKQAFPDAIMIFLLPPSADELAKRLRGRGKDSEAQIRLRLGHARHEMEQFPHYNYLVVNDDLEQAYRELESIVLAARCAQARSSRRAKGILETFETPR
jgi:guanylate kinase